MYANERNETDRQNEGERIQSKIYVLNTLYCLYAELLQNDVKDKGP